ncbi:conserved hypothetical protein [Talaromyces marneffei ATCC 18224]|uniref:Transcription factor domain-containing protein n=1 Tax=Talaromyces marneffei (strain ATCC 18224 / CBS 334.59 / QM 7333) TaxID=441960 RepID=B6QHV6_TALMQ|nr:conserved hypothetical protein [Talaromyces marneffei ATCC 18224]
MADSIGRFRACDASPNNWFPQRQVELEGDSQTPDDMTRNTSGVRPFSAGPQAAAESHPPSTTSAAELFQASSGVYSPHFQLQQWTLDTLSSQTTLPQDWLAEISRQIEIEQITDSLPTSEWESYLHQTPTTMMGNWRNPPMLDANMTGLAGNATDEPYRRGSFEDDMALNSGESQGDRESVTIQDSPQRLFPTNFRPKSIQCFSQARFNIERLEHILKTQNQWFGGYFDSPQPGRKKARASAEPISNTTRDQLLVVTQLLLQQSRTIHNRNAASSGSANINPLNEALISLPPTRVFDALIESYCNSFEKYFRLCPGPSFTPNEIFKQLPKHGKIAGILLLLMIAVGAAATPSIESHDFAIGVAEICRLAFSEILERDFSITVEPLISQCALLLLYLGMWAGERWLMGISSAQREMYIHLFHSATSLPKSEITEFPSDMNLHDQWSRLKDQGFRSRLVYGWAMADQEWSLFYDKPNVVSVEMLVDPMPEDDTVWKTSSAAEWATLGSGLPMSNERLSLRDFYHRFINGELRVSRETGSSQLSLRLLLVPLQSMVCHLREWIHTFANGQVRWRQQAQSLSNSAIQVQLHQVRGFLLEWFTLAFHSSTLSSTNSPFSLVTLVIYHLISLNVMTDFREIDEALVNGVMPDRATWNPSVSGTQSSEAWVIAQDSEEEVLVHCGQVLRLYRLMPLAHQPLWWPAAIHRVFRIVCFVAMARHPSDWLQSRNNSPQNISSTQGGRGSLAGSGSTSTNPGIDILSTSTNSARTEEISVPPSGERRQSSIDLIALDVLDPDHPTLVHYLKYKEGEPVLALKDAYPVSLKTPKELIRYFLEVLDGDRGVIDGDTTPSHSKSLLERSLRSVLEEFAGLWGVPIAMSTAGHSN